MGPRSSNILQTAHYLISDQNIWPAHHVLCFEGLIDAQMSRGMYDVCVKWNFPAGHRLESVSIPLWNELLWGGREGVPLEFWTDHGTCHGEGLSGLFLVQTSCCHSVPGFPSVCLCSNSHRGQPGAPGGGAGVTMQSWRSVLCLEGRVLILPDPLTLVCLGGESCAPRDPEEHVKEGPPPSPRFGGNLWGAGGERGLH